MRSENVDPATVQGSNVRKLAEDRKQLDATVAALHAAMLVCARDLVEKLQDSTDKAEPAAADAYQKAVEAVDSALQALRVAHDQLDRAARLRLFWAHLRQGRAPHFTMLGSMSNWANQRRVERVEFDTLVARVMAEIAQIHHVFVEERITRTAPQVVTSD